MAPFSHLLLTRFNVRMGLADALVLDESWLDHRLDLFRRFTVPTVAAQTEPNFRWLLFLDRDTPAAFLARLEQLRNEVRLSRF